jgi:hypothetical protein
MQRITNRKKKVSRGRKRKQRKKKSDRDHKTACKT